MCRERGLIGVVINYATCRAEDGIVQHNREGVIETINPYIT